MNKTIDCMYCLEDERRDNLMIEICKLDVSTVFLMKEQTYKGRCNVVFNGHVKELFHLSQADRMAYMNDICKVAQAIDEVYHPDKINYGSFGDKLPHLHMHVVPKYLDDPSWSPMFEMNPGKVYLSDAGYAEMIEKIKKYL